MEWLGGCGSLPIALSHLTLHSFFGAVIEQEDSLIIVCSAQRAPSAAQVGGSAQSC
eukprot:m.419 g.419  ORF g.419 m.419 type:complete len:56 (-) comp126_c1_seq1:164-331(-)